MIKIIEIYLRNKTGTIYSNKIKKLGYIPSIIYNKNIKNINIKIKENEIISYIDKYNENNLILKLNNENINVYIKKINYHISKNKIIHIDFIKI